MARLSLSLIIVLFVSIYQVPSIQSRKLLNAEKEATVIFQMDNSVPSIPEKPLADKDQMMANNERLFAVHLARLDRILQSVPSPGGGN
ncbi:hypothetical protein V6N13_049888 [Hibiscus sabdariffa]|uniref:Uncharacterized protein n=1 Tax=Hibiscus sabdariffa TaxID=183260 RepID=A0ABR2QVV3_9ROSI